MMLSCFTTNLGKLGVPGPPWRRPAHRVCRTHNRGHVLQSCGPSCLVLQKQHVESLQDHTGAVESFHIQVVYKMAVKHQS